MTKEEKKTISEEIAKTYELFNFQMSFTEYKDIFELGATFGHHLASIEKRADATEISTISNKDITVWELKREKVKSNKWFSKIYR